MAQVWKKAIGSLDEQDLRVLLRYLQHLQEIELALFLIRFLMERNYSFREMILYNTDTEF